MIQHQPLELVRAIIECIDDYKTMQSLRLVSRAACYEVEPFLYNTVYLGDSARETLATRLQVFSARLETSGPRIAPYVKHIVVHPYATSTKSQPEAFRPLVQILARLINLESFKYDSLTSCFIPTQTPCPILGALSGSDIPPSLRRLTWNHYACDANVMSKVLERHKGLERLDLPWSVAPLEVSQDALSRLYVLHCGVDTALSILPGRRVTHIQVLLTSHGFTSPPDSSGFAYIRVFSAKGNWDIAFALGRHIPSMECMELSCHYVTEPWYIELGRLLPTLLESTHLRCIHIAGYSRFRCASLGTVMQDCFTKLPDLQWIEVQHSNDIEGRVFERWTRNSKGYPTLIEYDEVWDWVDGWDEGYRYVDPAPPNYTRFWS